VGQKPIFEERKVGHGDIDHRGPRAIAIFCNYDVSSPSCRFFEKSSLYLAYRFVDLILRKKVAHKPMLLPEQVATDREKHSITRDSGVKNDIRVCELADHAVERLDELCYVINKMTHSRVVASDILDIPKHGAQDFLRCNPCASWGVGLDVLVVHQMQKTFA